MREFFKWFWNNLDFKNWKFEGRELANPFRILWRLIWIIPAFGMVYITAFIFCVYNFDFSDFGDFADRIRNF